MYFHYLLRRIQQYEPTHRRFNSRTVQDYDKHICLDIETRNY